MPINALGPTLISQASLIRFSVCVSPWTVYGWSSAPKGLQTQSLFNVQNKNISCVTQQKCWQRQVFNSPAVS